MDTEGILLLMMCRLHQAPVPFQVTSISGLFGFLLMPVTSIYFTCTCLKKLYWFVGNCDFESRTFCTWVNLQNDDFDWLVGSGGTASSFTGPQQDHTVNQDQSGNVNNCTPNDVSKIGMTI